MRQSTSIYRRMIFYFLLIIIASVFMLGEFYYQTNNKKYKKIYTETFNNYRDGEISIDKINKPLEIIQKKVTVMMILLYLFIFIIIMMIIKDIVLPVRYMIKISQKISEGDLSKTINMERNDDLAILGGVINELTSNLQELITITGNLNNKLPINVENIKKCLYRLADVKNRKELREIVECVAKELKDIKNTADELKVIYDSFKLYTIKKENK